MGDQGDYELERMLRGTGADEEFLRELRKEDSREEEYRDYLLYLPWELERSMWGYEFFVAATKEDDKMWGETQPHYEEYENQFRYWEKTLGRQKGIKEYEFSPTEVGLPPFSDVAFWGH